VFTSDNGPAINKGSRGGKSYPLQGGKGLPSEGGFRVPCVMRWPGRIAPGRLSGEIITAMDIMPTFSEAIGVTIPGDHTIDGRSVLDVITGVENAQSPHNAFFYYSKGRLRAVRQGPWKLLFQHRDGAATPWRLFNLATDISETTDVKSDHPDIVDQLTELAQQKRAELGDAGTGQTGEARRPLGRVDKRGRVEDVYMME
jgi:arylsulfatase A-like enzyme